MKEKVLLMYSGGMDSTLAAVRLVTKGYKVEMLHFDNGCSISLGYVDRKAHNLEKRFGKEKIEFIGKITIVPEFRENEFEIGTMTLKEIIDKYGNTTISQIRCLNCRSAMYHEAILYCLNNDIHYIAEGARKSQLFAIEQPQVISSIKELLEEFNIELLLPVFDIKNEWEKENELMLFSDDLAIIGEDKCFLGLPQDHEIPEDEILSIKNIFDTNIKPRYVEELKKEQPRQLIYKKPGKFEFM